MNVIGVEEINKRVRRLTTDEDTTYLCDIAWIRENGVESDCAINEEKEKELKEFTEAYSLDRALKYIGFKRRTEKEVENHLIKIRVPEDVVGVTLLKMVDFGMIDDKMYAHDYIDELIGKSQSTYVIKMKSIKKGLDAALVEATMIEMKVREKEGYRAFALLKKRYGTGAVSIDSIKAKQYLYRKGFSADAISKSLEYHFASIGQ
ncbi:MAG: RecX family transcriptional regulator [Peptostreptococcaceae bacterium]|nr:RecX family transcriptional regulator [Peptostreptococcaceae bacterium]